MYTIYKLPIFDSIARKLLSRKEQSILAAFIEKLRVNPFIGKPLGFTFLREKKIGGKRVYFLIYQDICIVLLASASDKKAQQKEIKGLKERFTQYKNLVIEINKGDKN